MSSNDKSDLVKPTIMKSKIDAPEARWVRATIQEWLQHRRNGENVLSLKELAGYLTERDFPVTVPTIRKWLQYHHTQAWATKWAPGPTPNGMAPTTSDD